MHLDRHKFGLKLDCSD